MHSTQTDTSGTERREPAEDLAMIRRLMEQSQSMVRGAAPHYLLWSALVTAALLLNWSAVQGLVGLGEAWIWLVAIGAGWIGSMWIGYRQDRVRTVSTPAGRVETGIWIGAGVAMTLIGFVGMASGTLAPSAMMAALASLMGGAYFATGALHDSPWLLLVAGGWWAGAVALFLWPGLHALLVTAGLMVAFHLVPGIVVYRANGGRPGGSARGHPA